jgi:hypothetical protein
MAADDAFAWSATRRLEWSDFRGAAPSDGSGGALTAYTLLYGVRCNGARFEASAIAAFLPHRSWVKPAVLADPRLSRQTLAHEQTHFDLTEVYARRLRAHFADLYDPCRTGAAQARDGAERIISAEAAAQRRYDDETRHGLIPERQLQWDLHVAGELYPD